ncbi:MAG: reverse transcriptase-like protein [Novosphingobium sp.]
MQSGLKIYFDGGSRPNPGPIEAAVVIRGTPHFFDDLGTGSNTCAEWQALLCAMTLARDLGLQDFQLLGDSREVVREACVALSTGVPTNARTSSLLALAAQCRPRRIRWIKREQNLAGIALERRRHAARQDWP